MSFSRFCWKQLIIRAYKRLTDVMGKPFMILMTWAATRVKKSFWKMTRIFNDLYNQFQNIYFIFSYIYCTLIDMGTFIIFFNNPKSLFSPDVSATHNHVDIPIDKVIVHLQEKWWERRLTGIHITDWREPSQHDKKTSWNPNKKKQERWLLIDYQIS